MGAYSGTALYCNFVSTTFQADFRKFSVDEGINLIDSSAGNVAAESSINGLKKGSASLDLVMQTGTALTAGTALLAAVVVGTEGTLSWGPEGTATTKPKGSVLAVVESNTLDTPYDDVVALTVNWTFRGAVTHSGW